MQLTYNKFKQAVDSSAEKLFGKIAEAVATSDNAALVAMYDDKLVLLDEQKEEFYLCDYKVESGILTISNPDEIALVENDDTYLDEVVERYFDLDDDTPITVNEMMTGFNLKYRDDSEPMINEAKDLKYRKIMESPRIRAIKKVREVRDRFASDINKLMEENWAKQITHKVQNSQDSIPSALARVDWKEDYPIKVNIDQGKPVNMIKVKDNTNVMDAMKNLASHISDKWKSSTFRGKFEKMISQIMKTESFENSKAAVLNFLDENKELFVLNNELFEELIVKTTLMAGEGDTDTVLEIFEGIMKTPESRKMKARFIKENNLTQEKIAKINQLTEEGGEDTEMPSGDEMPSSEEGSKEAGNDLDMEELNKIKDIFKKIRKSLEDDSPEAEYIDGIISSLDSAKVQGIEDSKMKEVIDFLSSTNEKGEEEPEESEEDVVEEV